MDDPAAAHRTTLKTRATNQRGAALWLALALLPWLAAVALAGLSAQWHQAMGWQAWREHTQALHQADNRRALEARRQRRAQAAPGFTLLELLLVLALIATLTAWLWPGGQGAIQQARRADGHAALLLGAQWLSQADSPTALPVPLQRSPQGHYRLELERQAPHWQLHARPVGPQQADRCGTLTLTDAGQRQASGGGRCW